MYYVDDGLVIHDKGGAWGWYRLDTWRSELLSYDQLVDQVGRDARRYVALTGMDCHQVGVPQHYDVDGWLRRLVQSTSNPGAGFEELLEMQSGRVRDADSSRRVVYLGCKLEEPRRDGLWETIGVSELFRKTDRLLGLENPRPSEKALSSLRKRRDEVRKKVLTGYRTAELASSGELRRLLMRTLWRGLVDLPEPEARETWGGEARAL
ncbi:MAG: hypothetical protein M3Z97_14320, partial [Candidatus Dormibacteraeota bacterium]|nr:hypothetical protein [Candidatus Dormibacteraeota bacterium]